MVEHMDGSSGCCREVMVGASFQADLALLSDLKHETCCMQEVGHGCALYVADLSEISVLQASC
jgi:hypothetical protein